LFTYSIDGESIQPKLSTVSMETVFLTQDPFHRGGNFDVFKCTLKTNPRQVLVAKRFKGAVNFRDVFVSHHLCAKLLETFNIEASQVLGAREFKILDCDRLLEIDDEYYILQDFLTGNFTTYRPGTSDRHSITFRLSETFYHYSFIKSEHHHMIQHLTGVGNTIASCVLASQGSRVYGALAVGPEIIKDFFANHTCKSHCQVLQLPVVVPDVLPECMDMEIHQGQARRAPEKPWSWLDSRNRSYQFHPDMQAAITQAKAEDTQFVRIKVGDTTRSVLDMVRGQQLNLHYGDARYLHESKRGSSRTRDSHKAGATKEAARGEKEEAQITDTSVCQLQVDLDGGWHAYGDSVQKIVQEALMKGKKQITLNMNGNEYHVCFEKLEQVNKTNGNKRKVRLVMWDENGEH